LTHALVKGLFKDGIFRARDVTTGQLIEADTVAGLIPLIVPDLPVAAELLATARGPRFRLGDVRMVPSYNLTGPAFEPGRYWRGPSWFNTAWLIHRGLDHLGETGLARALRNDALNLAAATHFAEYVDPLNGDAHGIRDFSWTAALTLDLACAGQ
jgi:hypothetical protein